MSDESNELCLPDVPQELYCELCLHVDHPDHEVLTLQLGKFGAVYPDFCNITKYYFSQVDKIQTQNVSPNGPYFLARVVLGLTIFVMNKLQIGQYPYFTHDCL